MLVRQTNIGLIGKSLGQHWLHWKVLGPTWASLEGYWTKHGPHWEVLGPTLASLEGSWTNMGLTGRLLDQTWASLGGSWANTGFTGRFLGQHWPNWKVLGPTLAKLEGYWTNIGQIGVILGQQWPTWKLVHWERNVILTIFVTVWQLSVHTVTKIASKCHFLFSVLMLDERSILYIPIS